MSERRRTECENTWGGVASGLQAKGPRRGATFSTPTEVLVDVRSDDDGHEQLRLTVNGRQQSLLVGQGVHSNDTLAHVLRERLGLTGLKIACDQGACGACTVLMDGRAVLSCMVLAVEANGHDILTIEGLPEDDPVVRAFACQCEPGHGTALQCGFCTPGAVMTARAFLNENPDPTLEEVRQALAGNLCRCGCYDGIVQAVLAAATVIRERTGIATEPEPDAGSSTRRAEK